MRIFESYKLGGHVFTKVLLWEYDADSIDLQKCRRLVATTQYSIRENSHFSGRIGCFWAIIREIAPNHGRLYRPTSLGTDGWCALRRKAINPIRFGSGTLWGVSWAG